MNKNIRYVLVSLVLWITCTSVPAAETGNPYIGRWALTIPGGGAGWLGVTQEDGYLDAGILWGGGSVVPVASVYVDNDTLVVTRVRKVERKDDTGETIRTHTLTETIIGNISGDTLELEQIRPHSDGKGADRRTFTGKRIPPLPAKPDLSKAKYGKPIVLFNGNNLDGWRLTNPSQTNGWSVEDGVLVNRPVQHRGKPHISYGNLCTVEEFEDFNLKLEVNVPEKGNSGVYLRGIYEVQVSDSYGKDPDSHNMGAIYSRIKPSMSAEKPAGQWQTMNITLLDRHVTVELNGKVIIDNEPLLGCTGGALWSDESRPGPIYLQGDHKAVDYRNIVLTPIIKSEVDQQAVVFEGRFEGNLDEGFVWKSDIPEDCPFDRSPSLTGIRFTSRHSDYTCGDTWYPSWASDGNLYSPWTDGKTDGMGCSSAGSDDARTAHAVMIGDDPVNLTIKNTSPVKVAAAMPYAGRYPAGSLVHNGIWYYATYCLGPSGGYTHRGFKWNWPNLGPMPGFQISRDLGKTWTPSPLSPSKPLFPEPTKHLGPVKMGAPHFVDFGKNMEHSPDGKAYMLGMGAVKDDPMPRPCLRVGQPGEPFETRPCTEDFAHGNLSWISADQIYLARVTTSPETINDIKAWEFFAGYDKNANPVWTNAFEKIKPLIEWNNNMGCVTATYVPGLKKYLMCVTDGWPTVAKMDSYILEADTLTGPWRIVTYMKDFGEQAYFLNFPSKFISSDGRTLWLCYSANFSSGWNGMKLEFNPPGGRYGLCLHEVELLEAESP